MKTEKDKEKNLRKYEEEKKQTNRRNEIKSIHKSKEQKRWYN